MNNFAEDEFTEKDSNPDLDLNRAPEDALDDAGEEDVDSSSGASKWIRIPLRIVAGLYLIGLATATYWGMMPEPFQVEKMATTMALTSGHREEGQPLPLGYRYTSTLIYLADEIMLGKPGGWMSNDWIPISRWSDNMRSWEKGAIIQYRVMVQGLRFKLSRSGPQSQEHPELTEADAKFNIRQTSWMVPRAESSYREGADSLKQFLEGLSQSESTADYFAPRQDQVIDWLNDQSRMLGTYTASLQRNLPPLTYDAGVLTSNDTQPDGNEVVGNSSVKKTNTFRTRDNAFYEVRGGVYVMYHCMLAMRKDAEVVINNAQAMGVMNRILNELESANKPMKSPMVLNGKEFGMLQNHSLVMASHLAKAHLAIKELQQQLRGGGSL
jgi:hypothetical protein